jgi:hypothetical protein
MSNSLVVKFGLFSKITSPLPYINPIKERLFKQRQSWDREQYDYLLVHSREISPLSRSGNLFKFFCNYL